MHKIIRKLGWGSPCGWLHRMHQIHLFCRNTKIVVIVDALPIKCMACLQLHLWFLWSISTQRFLRVIRKRFLCPYLQFYVNNTMHENNTEASCYRAWGSKIFINALKNGKLNSWQMTQSRHTCNLSIIIKPTITTSRMLMYKVSM